MDRLSVPKTHTRRLGKINIAEVDDLLGELPFMFSLIAFIPIHISIHEFMARIIYTGYSNHFDQLNDGDIIPEYILHLRGAGRDTVVEKVQRVKDEIVIRKFPNEGG